MFLAGEIERREALSSSCIANAHQAFIDEGYMQVETSTKEVAKKVALVSSFDDVRTVKTIEERIAIYLSGTWQD